MANLGATATIRDSLSLQNDIISDNIEDINMLNYCKLMDSTSKLNFLNSIGKSKLLANTDNAELELESSITNALKRLFYMHKFNDLYDYFFMGLRTLYNDLISSHNRNNVLFGRGSGVQPLFDLIMMEYRDTFMSNMSKHTAVSFFKFKDME